MEMEFLNCRCCGGALDTYSNLSICKHCGATNFISDVANKNIIQLNRANKLRQESEFDNAARIYDNILKENRPTADILWYRTLCEYGIEYVPDPVSDKFFPTLHRISDESILDCSFFKQAYELSEGEQKETLLKEAKYINEVQTRYLNIAADEDPYDVFICYKETDIESGEMTEDVLLAEELYNELTGKGYKVFFARETLKEKLSVEYEPYIFAAIKSAKAMAVIGSKAEYFTSVWVKNEWGRFLKLMKNNPDKQMFFACDDPEELPRAFAYKQAQLIGEEGAIKNLAGNIEIHLKELGSDNETVKEDMYNTAVSYLESGDVNAAKFMIDKIISQYPDYAKGYWLRMLYANNARPSNIKELPRFLKADPDYELALNFASGDLKEEYIKINEICKVNQKYQDEFDKIVREKSEEYINNFDKTKAGAKKDNILEIISKYCNEVDIYNNKLRFSSNVGYSLFYLGMLLFVIFMMIYSDSYGLLYETIRYKLMLRNLICGIVILAGIFIGLSYNMVLDISITVISGVLLTLAVIFPETGFLWIFFAVLIPTLVFVLTYMNSKLNQNRSCREDASTGIINELEKLKNVLTLEAKDEMNAFVENLLKQYKEEKRIKSVIEIKEKDYKKELIKIDNIYQYAKEEYTKYIEVSFPKKEEEDGYSKKDLNNALMGFMLFPVFGPIGAVIDILTDKYNTRNHAGSCIAMFLSVGLMFLFVFAESVAILM